VKTSTRRSRDWRTYERFVASLCKPSDDLTVTPNAKLIGAISGTPRQIDVLVDARFQEDASRRVIVDAKRWKKKVDVTDVEAFGAMMEDCRASRGILVCSAGFTAAAKRRAQDRIGLRLLPISELRYLDLESWEGCIGSCQTSKRRRKHRGMVLFDQPFGTTVGNAPLIVNLVGKCDECGSFHVWCWTRGSKFALSDQSEHHCGCSWFWLTAIESEGVDEHGNELRAVLLLMTIPVVLRDPDERSVGLLPAVLVVDRRPLE